MEIKCWAIDRPVSSPFAFPEGRAGRWAGRFMRMTNRQKELALLMAPRPGERVLEVGYGPGALIAILARSGAGIYGVDPSAEMRALATRRNAGRADLRLGTADATGFADGYFDHVVSVNNVALWPDLGKGLSELRRVTRPGGTVLIAWHGGTSPPLLARRFRLPDERLAQIDEALTRLFARVRRHELRALTVFRAIR
ncbi:class I SAM-dependent methyltransferase [Acrocarpospora catenulata]|uniref:class I SAM-dependent methyltransferase n=1 Tax=Acrocarpospora catenulata TaxID=2836182 RepID=UPI001BDA1D19|nr:methyltransferase domain-containing protein [Acrocarpospora catenulata]